MMRFCCTCLMRRSIVASIWVRPTWRGGRSVMQSLFLMGTMTGVGTVMGWTKQFVHFPNPPSPPELATTTTPTSSNTTNYSVAKVFLRVLIVPSLCEEIIWRVLLQPPGCSMVHACIINSFYTLSHVLYATILRYYYYDDDDDERPALSLTRYHRPALAASVVFMDPTFLS
jgi:predicted Abi (CAAX) family protease